MVKGAWPLTMNRDPGTPDVRYMRSHDAWRWAFRDDGGEWRLQGFVAHAREPGVRIKIPAIRGTHDQALAWVADARLPPPAHVDDLKNIDLREGG